MSVSVMPVRLRVLAAAFRAQLVDEINHDAVVSFVRVRWLRRHALMLELIARQIEDEQQTELYGLAVLEGAGERLETYKTNRTTTGGN